MTFHLYRSSPGASSWLLCSLLHLRKVLKSTIQTEFAKLEVLGTAETISMLDERLRYIATTLWCSVFLKIQKQYHERHLNCSKAFGCFSLIKTPSRMDV